MSYSYDFWGWYSPTPIAGRQTDIPPPDALPEGQAPNWTGYDWRVLPYTPPPPDVPAPPERQILTRLEFLRRFTPEERVAIRAASLAEPLLADYLTLLELAEQIRTDDPDTVAGVQRLEAFGLLAAGRAAEILA